MKVLFLLAKRVNAGSIQAISNYVRAGDQLGHEFAMFGRSDPTFPTVRFSTDLAAFDRVVIVVESRMDWLQGLRASHVLAAVPRHRRVVLDADGMWNPVVSLDGYDRNHPSERAREQWMAGARALSDRVLQPTLTPLDPHVEAFPFYGYDADAGGTGTGVAKRFDILHVGHNWWRWREVSTVLLPALERIRGQLGDICFLGSWWDAVPAWVRCDEQAAFVTDVERLTRAGIQIRRPVPYTEVVSAMSASRVNVMTQRPLFRVLRLLTSKYFELLAADTIPLVMLDPDHAESVYGPAGREFCLHECVADKLLDALAEPGRYAAAVDEVRRYLEEHHSYLRRVRQLTAVLGEWESAA